VVAAVLPTSALARLRNRVPAAPTAATTIGPTDARRINQPALNASCTRSAVEGKPSPPRADKEDEGVASSQSPRHRIRTSIAYGFRLPSCRPHIDTQETPRAHRCPRIVDTTGRTRQEQRTPPPPAPPSPNTNVSFATEHHLQLLPTPRSVSATTALPVDEREASSSLAVSASTASRPATPSATAAGQHAHRGRSPLPSVDAATSTTHLLDIHSPPSSPREAAQQVLLPPPLQPPQQQQQLQPAPFTRTPSPSRVTNTSADPASPMVVMRMGVTGSRAVSALLEEDAEFAERWRAHKLAQHRIQRLELEASEYWARTLVEQVAGSERDVITSRSQREMPADHFSPVAHQTSTSPRIHGQTSTGPRGSLPPFSSSTRSRSRASSPPVS
jgi:hypothetical protein